MKSRGYTFIASLVTLLLLAGSCAKESYTIGRGDPDDEIKQCLRLSAKGKHEDAIQCLEMFKARYPETKLGQEAELLIGDSYFARKDYLLAAEAYAAFIRLYPMHPKVPYARYRIGYCYFKESPKAIDRDQAYLTQAIEHLRTVVRRYPNSEYRDVAFEILLAARKRIARRHYYIGRFYYRSGEYIACIPRFMEIAENYAESGLADKALYMALKAHLGLNQVDDAREVFSKMSTDFPQSKYTKMAERKMLRAIKKAS